MPLIELAPKAGSPTAILRLPADLEALVPTETVYGLPCPRLLDCLPFPLHPKEGILPPAECQETVRPMTTTRIDASATQKVSPHE